VRLTVRTQTKGHGSARRQVSDKLGQPAPTARGRIRSRAVGRQLRAPARTEQRGPSRVVSGDSGEHAGGGARYLGRQKPATAVAARVTALADPKRRTLTITWTCTPRTSAKSPRRRWAEAARATPETKIVSRATSTLALGRTRVRWAAARAGRSDRERGLRWTGAAATGGGGRPPTRGKASGAPAAPAEPPATASPLLPVPCPRRRQRRKTNVNAPPEAGAAEEEGEEAQADA